MPTTIDVRIEGVAALLQHRRPLPEEEEELDAVETTGKRDWTREFETSKYQDEDGKLYQPSDHIHGSLLKAAVNFQIPGKGKKTYKDLVNAALVIEPDAIPHLKQECVLDRRWARVQRNQVLRHRPKLEEWALDFQLIITNEQLPVQAVRDILNHAGKCVGIGDYRPKFGRFQVVKWEVANEAG